MTISNKEQNKTTEVQRKISPHYIKKSVGTHSIIKKNKFQESF